MSTSVNIRRDFATLSVVSIISYLNTVNFNLEFYQPKSGFYKFEILLDLIILSLDFYQFFNSRFCQFNNLTIKFVLLIQI